MIKEDLIYFLKNGRLKNIKFGIKRNEIIELIGKPDFVLPEKSKNPTLFEYDNVEFYFEDKDENARLQFIQIDYPIEYSKKGKLIFDGYNWTTELTIEKAINFLNKKIKFEEKLDSNNLNFGRILQTESGVEVHFTNQENDKVWKLHSVGRSINLNPIKPKTKQISFEIEDSYYNQLKEISHKTKVSIANLCREIIENHLKDN